MNAAQSLHNLGQQAQDIAVRCVSMPNRELFEALPQG